MNNANKSKKQMNNANKSKKQMNNANKSKKNKAATLLTPGNVVLIRTAVYHALGRVVGIVDVGGVAFVMLEHASYVGDTGRYHEATARPLREVSSSEVEPVGLGGRMDVQVGAICDVALAADIETAVK
jgi:hypothetical protein